MLVLCLNGLLLVDLWQMVSRLLAQASVVFFTPWQREQLSETSVFNGHTGSSVFSYSSSTSSAPSLSKTATRSLVHDKFLSTLASSNVPNSFCFLVTVGSVCWAMSFLSSVSPTTPTLSVSMHRKQPWSAPFLTWGRVLVVLLSDTLVIEQDASTWPAELLG